MDRSHKTWLRLFNTGKNRQEGGKGKAKKISYTLSGGRNKTWEVKQLLWSKDFCNVFFIEKSDGIISSDPKTFWNGDQGKAGNIDCQVL